jgi:hypothetical protein
MARRRFALSSSVRSKNCTACGLIRIRLERADERASEAIRSERIGFRLYGHRRGADLIALERLLDLAERLEHRMSALNFAALAAMPLTTPSTWASSFRLYVCPLTGDRRRKFDLGRHAPSRARATRSWSPRTTPRKLACVPVVPFTPRQGSVANAMIEGRPDPSTRSCIHKVARLPTVVGCARLQVRVAKRRLGAPLASECREAPRSTVARGHGAASCRAA